MAVNPYPQPYSDSKAYVLDAASNNKGEVSKALLDMGEGQYKTTFDVKRWNKLYPYALILANVSEDSRYEEIARFVLPIPPEQMSIQSPFAIITSKTLGGVVEEHAGLPFKLVVIQGTTGIYANRSTIGQSSKSSPTGIFGGTIAAVQEFKTASKTGAPPPVTLASSSDEALYGTGYAQFRLLQMFLESYAHAKKLGNKTSRLLFVPFKDETAFVVTPVMFNLRREATKALEYRYDLQLKVWNEVPASSLSSPSTPSINTDRFTSRLSSVLGKLVKAQQMLLKAVSVINAFRADIQAILNVVRQCILTLKLVLDATISLMELPGKIINDIKSSVINSWENLKNSIERIDGLFRELGQMSLNGGSSKAQSRSYKEPPSQGQRNNKTGVEFDPSILDAMFANPYSNNSYALLSQINVSQLDIPAALQKKIDEEYERVSSFTQNDFINMQATVQAAAVSISDTVGASDAQFDATYLNTHPDANREPSLEDFNVLYAINDILDGLNTLATTQTESSNVTMDYVAGLAAASGIAFQTPTSKFAIPFPYDTSLEQVASMYLKDPDRWMEIATLNGLREPYVDEIGFSRYLLGNGKLSEIIISNEENLRIGQPVWLQSNFIAREKRHILNINKVSEGNIVVTLDGAADLDKYKVSANAYLHAFLPDTVNSHQLIYIPSNDAADDNSELAKIPGIDAYDHLLELGGVDLLLTSDNDLAVTSDGDCRLAYGLQSFVQRAKITLGTPQGSLIRHPNFGLPLAVGQSIADLDFPSLAQSCRDLFKEDPSFDGVVGVSISQAGPALTINMSLAISGQETPLPVSVQVVR